MNKQYIRKLIKTNRTGKLIKLIIDNVHNWSVHDFETIYKNVYICNIHNIPTSIKNWRLLFFIKRYFAKEYQKELKETNRNYYDFKIIESWMYLIPEEFDIYMLIRATSCYKHISIVKYIINNKNISMIGFKSLLIIKFLTMNIKVLKYMFIPKHINMFNILLQERFGKTNLSDIRPFSHSKLNENIAELLSEKNNTCYNTSKLLDDVSINGVNQEIKRLSECEKITEYKRLKLFQYKELLIYLKSDDIKNRIPELYERVIKICKDHE